MLADYTRAASAKRMSATTAATWQVDIPSAEAVICSHDGSGAVCETPSSCAADISHRACGARCSRAAVGLQCSSSAFTCQLEFPKISSILEHVLLPERLPAVGVKAIGWLHILAQPAPPQVLQMWRQHVVWVLTSHAEQQCRVGAMHGRTMRDVP